MAGGAAGIFAVRAIRQFVIDRSRIT
jgi:hypothetical protein